MTWRAGNIHHQTVAVFGLGSWVVTGEKQSLFRATSPPAAIRFVASSCRNKTMEKTAPRAGAPFFLHQECGPTVRMDRKRIETGKRINYVIGASPNVKASPHTLTHTHTHTTHLYTTHYTPGHAQGQIPLLLQHSALANPTSERLSAVLTSRRRHVLVVLWIRPESVRGARAPPPSV